MQAGGVMGVPVPAGVPAAASAPACKKPRRVRFMGDSTSFRFCIGNSIQQTACRARDEI